MAVFLAPTFVSFIALLLIFFWGGATALLITLVLVILEITLSFDNAVVNAKVLQEMSAVWQRRFLTWGMLISVFGTRLILPIIIVSIVAIVSPLTVTYLALYDPTRYALMLQSADVTIKAFGGAFLMMVSLKYFFNIGKKIHWFESIEKHLVRWGRVESIEIMLAVIILLVVSLFSHHPVSTVLVSGLIGIVLFTLTEGIAHGLGVEARGKVRSGVLLFAYLNLIDTAFSLDGVIGAFAITNSLPVIFVGLGIGAYYVRAMTIYLVRQKTLTNLRYLEHGAHWAVFGLGLSMLMGLIFHIPQVVIASIGLLFIILAYFSSRKEIKNPAQY